MPVPAPEEQPPVPAPAVCTFFTFATIRRTAWLWHQNVASAHLPCASPESSQFPHLSQRRHLTHLCAAAGAVPDPTSTCTVRLFSGTAAGRLMIAAQAESCLSGPLMRSVFQAANSCPCTGEPSRGHRYSLCGSAPHAAVLPAGSKHGCHAVHVPRSPIVWCEWLTLDVLMKVIACRVLRRVLQPCTSGEQCGRFPLWERGCILQ